MRISGWSSDVCSSDLITIPRPTSSAVEKWLHDRGLYIDYLEDEAKQAVIDAKDECVGTASAETTAEQLRTCFLQVLSSEERSAGKECVSTSRSGWSL